MTAPDEESRSWSEIAEIFGDYLERQERGEDVQLADLVREHPDFDESLLQFAEDWHRAASALRGRLGGDAEQESEPAGPPEEFPRELLERLGSYDASQARYTVRREIDHGAMGRILKVWDRDLRRTLAMKVMRERAEDTSHAHRPTRAYRSVGRFLEEAQVTGQLDHPSIPPIHELGLDSDGHLYFTMPLIKGKNLREIFALVREGAEGWTLTRALGVIVKMLEALAFAHSRGVLHRDVKPSNVMVGRFGETYLMDWGLARVIGKEEDERTKVGEDSDTKTVIDLDGGMLTRDGDVVGTPAYMSPEQAAGELLRLGPTSDIYSVGAILYHLLTGRLPYQEGDQVPSAHVVVVKVLEGAPRPVLEMAPQADIGLASICEKAMARSPRDRFQDGLDMAREIEACLENRPVGPLTDRPWYVLRLAVRRNKGIFATALAALVLVVALFGIFVVGLEGERREREYMADLMSSRGLVAQERTICRPDAQGIARMETWIGRVDDLFSRRARYERLAASAEGVQAVEAAEILGQLERLQELKERILAKIAEVRDLPRITVEEEAGAWREARAAVAASPHYGGLEIAPQVGLVPLGESAEGLQEFWHVMSGERPEPDEYGSWDLAPETGIVLVLVPGGTFSMGAPLRESNRIAEKLHEVALRPFFLAKYEVTQAQWERLMGSNPSQYRPGHLEGTAAEGTVRPTNPVEQVSWVEADEYVRRLGLRLPTEAQWEYACRAGSSNPYTWGPGVGHLQGRENVRDQSFRLVEAFAEVYPWDDGCPLHAPVGSFEANRWGFFDMHGNVVEWCLDPFAFEHVVSSAAPGDGLNTVPGDGNRSFRGGSYYLELVHPPRCALRMRQSPENTNPHQGFRASRPLDPPPVSGP